MLSAGCSTIGGGFVYWEVGLRVHHIGPHVSKVPFIFMPSKAERHMPLRGESQCCKSVFYGEIPFSETSVMLKCVTHTSDKLASGQQIARDRTNQRLNPINFIRSRNWSVRPRL